MLEKHIYQQVLAYANDIWTLFSLHGHACVNLYIEGKPVCGSSNPHQAAALVRIQPQGTSRPTCWLGIREREKEDRVKWYRAGMRDKEKEKGPLSFSKEFVNVYNPIKQGEQLDPSHNMH